MSKPAQLSLSAAIMTNLNIMLGSGIFINTVLLAQRHATYGGLLYLISGALMLPLVISFMRLTQNYEGGGFYTFGALTHPFVGFISTWSYFIGKLASAFLGIHVFSTFVHHILPNLQVVPLYALDSILIVFFVLLNLKNLKTGITIQGFFFAMKIIPLLFVIGSGLIYFQKLTLAAPEIIWSTIPTSLPLTLFCFLGFEATCSLGKQIKNAQRNAPRAIFIAFMMVMCAAITYQTIFYGFLSNTLAFESYGTMFKALLTALHMPKSLLSSLFSLFIGCSALGGAYGIMYSNAWNLHTLAENNHLPHASFFKQLNTHAIPLVAVITEGIICLVYLATTGGVQVTLQYVATLSCILSYTLSIIGLYKTEQSLVSLGALATCALLLGICINSFIFTSSMPLIAFGLILLIGTGIFFSAHSLTNFKSN